MSEGDPPRVVLSLGNGCYRELTWEVSCRPRASISILVDKLVTAGFVDESQNSLVRELKHPDEHRIVLIPATGRIQLRLHYLTPTSERQPIARKLASLLSRVQQGFVPTAIKPSLVTAKGPAPCL